jgi:hypothetical protein
MSRGDPVEFTRQLAGGNLQRCGNRVRLEDENGNPIAPAGTLTVIQPNPNLLNANANMQVGDVDVGAANPVPVTQPNPDLLNANANMQVGDTDVGAANPVPVTDTWEVVTLSDEGANDSDKEIAVPAGYEYQVLWIWVEYTSDANAGNRQLEVDFRDAADDVIGQIRPGVTQAASLTRYYMFAPALADLGAFRDTDYLMTPLPPTMFLPAGYDIRIWDNNAVSAAGDDMIIQMQVARRAV